jgi:phage terminase small subunit
LDQKPDKRKPKRSGLGPKQNRFVAEFLKDLNATQAAIRAGYSPKAANSKGSQLYANAKVRAEIDAAIERRSERVVVEIDDVLRELLTFSRLDLGKAFAEDGSLLPVKEMPEEVRRAISGIDVEELFDGRGEGRKHVGNIRKVRFWDKAKGLELLGRHLKMWTDKLSLTGKDGEQLVIEVRKASG